ncbi:hypothetical protein ACIP4Y_18425 [Streptomyces sp. NPDC088810]|uniref:hypothetical protein n=1 Tax=Streptomyces sp. NPDC088810 TaxID=3365904 RepID=UPI00380939F8
MREHRAARPQPLDGPLGPGVVVAPEEQPPAERAAVPEREAGTARLLAGDQPVPVRMRDLSRPEPSRPPDPLAVPPAVEGRADPVVVHQRSP